MMLISSVLYFIGGLGILFHIKTSMIFLNIGMFATGMGWFIHNMAPMLFGQIYGKYRSSGIGFALFNFSAMLIGAFLGAKLGMYLTNLSAKTAGRITANGDDIMFAFKWLMIPVALSMFISFYLWKNRNKTVL